MKQVITLSKQLILIPSISDDSKSLEEILNICKTELKKFNNEEFKSNGIPSLLYYNSKNRPNNFKLILNAHLDVVPGKESQFKPFEKDGKLFGRGAYDMKTAAAAMIILFKHLAKKVNYPLGLQLVTDEEVGGFNGTKFQIENGVRADFIIAGENTDLKINHISKGIIWLKIITKGKSAHGAYPWLGENAIWKMNKALTILEKLYPEPAKEVWQTTANLSSIESSNKAFNKVPDECITYFDIRYIPKDKDNIIKNIKKHLGKDFEVEIVIKEPNHFTNSSNSFIMQLSNTIKKEIKQSAQLVEKHGASDIRHYNQVGCDGITFGPIGEGHHSDNEWVNIKSVENYYHILEKFLLNLEFQT